MENTVKTGFGRLIAAACFLWGAPVLAQTAWQPQEQVSHYNVMGTSGIELYASIGENGPKIGQQVRTIAHTNFKLTWTRDYRPQPDGACTLVTARPRLIITYTLPKLGNRLAPDVQAKWNKFISGIQTHEKVHGQQIIQMVKRIEEVSVGHSAANDPKCTKVRATLQEKLGEISRDRQKASSDFDKLEMSDGGNVHRLILELVN